MQAKKSLVDWVKNRKVPINNPVGDGERLKSYHEEIIAAKLKKADKRYRANSTYMKAHKVTQAVCAAVFQCGVTTVKRALQRYPLDDDLLGGFRKNF